MFGLVEVVGLERAVQGGFVFGEFLNVVSRLVKIFLEKLVVHFALTAQLLCPFHQFLPVYELFAQRSVIITVNQRGNQVINYFPVQYQTLYFRRWHFVQVFALLFVFLHYLQRLLQFFLQFAYEFIVWPIVRLYVMQLIFVQFWIRKQKWFVSSHFLLSRRSFILVGQFLLRSTFEQKTLLHFLNVVSSIQESKKVQVHFLNRSDGLL
jgi:hypothetical protein